MATTDVSICNLALQRIGQRTPITSLDPATDSSENAALCATAYPVQRDALLQRFTWGFATAQSPLARVGGDATADSGWVYRYSLPTGFLRGQYIFDGANRPGRGLPTTSFPALPGLPASQQLPFEVRGGYIYSDTFVPPLWSNAATYALGDVVYYAGAFYSSLAAGNLNHAPAAGSAYWSSVDPQPAFVYTLQADPSAFSPLFVDALAWRMAADLALSLATKGQLATSLGQVAEVAFKRAAAAELNGRQFDPKPESRFISGRS